MELSQDSENLQLFWIIMDVPYDNWEKIFDEVYFSHGHDPNECLPDHVTSEEDRLDEIVRDGLHDWMIHEIMNSELMGWIRDLDFSVEVKMESQHTFVTQHEIRMTFQHADQAMLFKLTWL